MKSVFFFKTLVLLLFMMILGTACQNVNKEFKEYITIKELKILSEKGTSLSWNDFSNYSYEDIGSGIYIRKFNIEGGHHLLVAGKSLNDLPDTIYQ